MNLSNLYQTGQTSERDGDVELGRAVDQSGHDRGGKRGDQRHAGQRHTSPTKDIQVTLSNPFCELLEPFFPGSC